MILECLGLPEVGRRWEEERQARHVGTTLTGEQQEEVGGALQHLPRQLRRTGKFVYSHSDT